MGRFTRGWSGILIFKHLWAEYILKQLDQRGMPAELIFFHRNTHGLLAVLVPLILTLHGRVVAEIGAGRKAGFAPKVLLTSMLSIGL